MQQYRLKHYWRSSCSWRVRWALELKQLKYSLEPVNLLEKDQRKDDYLKLNPAGFVPAFFNGKTWMGESLAIIEWLDTQHTEILCVPRDPMAAANVRQIAYSVACGIQPIQNLVVQQYVSDVPEERQKFAAHWIERGFHATEALLAQHSGRFSVGDHPSLADLCLIPQVYNARRFNVDLDLFPNIRKVDANALTTEACQAAHPDRHAPA